MWRMFLEGEELEAIERHLVDVVRDRNAKRLHCTRLLQSNFKLTAQTALLGRCVAMTAENLQVLARLRSSRIESTRLMQG
jgi:hypothetical protein